MLNLRLVCSAFACGVLLPAAAAAAPITNVVDRPATQTRLATSSAMMDVCEAGTRLVAVGERGIVLLSDDTGRSWRQASVPVSVSLTAVQFVDARLGWAVGHSGVVLHSTDGGETWQRQFDGKVAADVAKNAAGQRAAARPDDSAAQRELATATQWTQDGPDKPFLGLLFDSAERGFVVGAYGMIFHTSDGGRTWTSWLDKVPNPDGMHLYAIKRDGRTVYLAGEQGYFARSDDDGRTFSRLPTPRKVSLFALATLPDGGVIVGGLRGNAYRSADRGNTWVPIDLHATDSVSALRVGPDRKMLMTTQAGGVLRSDGDGREFVGVLSSTLPINAFSVVDNGGIVMAGPRGVSRQNLVEAGEAARSAVPVQGAR